MCHYCMRHRNHLLRFLIRWVVMEDKDLFINSYHLADHQLQAIHGVPFCLWLQLRGKVQKSLFITKSSFSTARVIVFLGYLHRFQNYCLFFVYYVYYCWISLCVNKNKQGEQLLFLGPVVSTSSNPICCLLMAVGYPLSKPITLLYPIIVAFSFIKYKDYW
jgi:hypothetical protein